MSATRHHRPLNFAFPATFAIFCCLSLALPAFLPGQPINEGFNNFDSGTRPAGWTFIGCNADTDTYTTPGDFGVASPSIKLDGDGDAIVTAPLYRPGDLTFWVKGMGTDISSSLLVEEYYLNKPAGWTEVTSIIPLPAVGTNLGGFSLEFLTTSVRFIYGQSLGDLAFDDVAITLADPTPSVTPSAPPTATPTLTPPPTPTPTPLTNFYNPSFELEPPLTGWNLIATGTSTVRSDEQAFDGIYSLKFGNPTDSYDSRGADTDLSVLVPVIAGQKYIFSGRFFVLDEGSGTIENTQFRFNVIWMDDGDQVVFTNVDEGWYLLQFDTWQERVKTLTAPTGATQVRIYVACKETDNPNNDAYTDYFTLSRPPAITVTSPVSAAAWYVGESYGITWDSVGLTGNVDIHYSLNDGAAWTPIAFNHPDTGSYSWFPIPAPPSNQARIRVREAGGMGVSGLSGRFTIASRDSINVLSPGGGETWFRSVTYNIQWSAGPDTSGDPVDLAYSLNGGGSWTPIVSGLPIASGSYAWTVPEANSPNSLVRVRQPVTGVFGQSPAVFTIASPFFTVTRPIGGETWYFGQNQLITWQSTSGIVGNVNIEYSATGPSGPWHQIAANYPNTGSYPWAVANVNTGSARVRVSEVGGIGLPGISANNFTLIGLAPPQPPVKRGWERWLQVDTQGCNILSIKAFDENNIWIGCACGVIYYWNGIDWRLQATVGINIRDFVAFRSDLVYGGGSAGQIARYNGPLALWSKDFEDGQQSIRVIDGPDPDHLIASAASGRVYYYTNSGWKQSATGESGTLYGLVYLRPDEAYVLRSATDINNSRIYKSVNSGLSWTTFTSFGSWVVGGRPLGGCKDQFGNTRLWAVGDCGEIWHYNGGGGGWFKQTQIGFVNFESVEVLDENNVWASGNGVIYHYNGSEWMVEDTSLPTVYQFSAVSNRLVYGIGSTASKWIFRTLAFPSPTPPRPTPEGFKTPSPTPVPLPGPIEGRVYDRVTGVGVPDVYVRVYPLELGLRPAGNKTDAAGNYLIDGINVPLEAGVYQVFAQGSQGSGIHTYRDQWYNQKDRQSQAASVPSNSSGIDFPLYRAGVFPTPAPTTPPIFSAVRVASGDYGGDGSSDIAIFRPASGLWAIRGVTRSYFGREGDIPVSGDYSGNGIADIALFRSSSGLWAVRGLTRLYFGREGDIPVPGDYDGDGSVDVAVFRAISGLWAVSGLGRSYFGAPGDVPVSGDYTGDGFMDIAIFRPASGLWAVKDITRVYFGDFRDSPVPGDYSGLGMAGPAIFRPSSGLWAIRGVTRTYFGSAAYQPIPGDYLGDGRDRIGVFRPDGGLWVIQGLTRVYFGRREDLPSTR